MCLAKWMDGKISFNSLIRKERVGNRGCKYRIELSPKQTYEILVSYLSLKLQRRSPRGHSTKLTRTTSNSVLCNLGNFEAATASTGKMCKHSTAAARGGDGSGQALRQSEEPERSYILAKKSKSALFFCLQETRSGERTLPTHRNSQVSRFPPRTVNTRNTKRKTVTVAMGTVRTGWAEGG